MENRYIPRVKKEHGASRFHIASPSATTHEKGKYTRFPENELISACEGILSTVNTGKTWKPTDGHPLNLESRPYNVFAIPRWGYVLPQILHGFQNCPLNLYLFLEDKFGVFYATHETVVTAVNVTTKTNGHSRTIPETLEGGSGRNAAVNALINTNGTDSLQV